MFRLIDKDGNGFVERNELLELLQGNIIIS
jgi:Ca2+-binding EF-hand superfamily protein